MTTIDDAVKRLREAVRNAQRSPFILWADDIRTVLDALDEARGQQERFFIAAKKTQARAEAAEAERDEARAEVTRVATKFVIGEGEAWRIVHEQRARVESVEAERDHWRRAAERQASDYDALQARVNEALTVTMSGSVPLGVTEARHYDRLLAEVRRILSGPTVLAGLRVRVAGYSPDSSRTHSFVRSSTIPTTTRRTGDD